MNNQGKLNFHAPGEDVREAAVWLKDVKIAGVMTIGNLDGEKKKEKKKKKKKPRIKQFTPPLTNSKKPFPSPIVFLGVALPPQSVPVPVKSTSPTYGPNVYSFPLFCIQYILFEKKKKTNHFPNKFHSNLVVPCASKP